LINVASIFYSVD